MLVLENLKNHKAKENHILSYGSKKFILLSWYISFQSPFPHSVLLTFVLNSAFLTYKNICAIL